MKLDAHRITEGLYVGGSPPRNVGAHGFDVLVLCASQDQFARDVRAIVRVPLEDNAHLHPLEAQDVRRALQAAEKVHQARKRGKKVLVTCQAGVNRSAFVAALALVRGGWTPEGAIERVRERRKPPVGMMPLSNPQFESIVRHFSQRSVPAERGRA